MVQLLFVFIRLAVSRASIYVAAFLPLLSVALSSSMVALGAYWQVMRHLLLPFVQVVVRLFVVCFPPLSRCVRSFVLVLAAQPRQIVMMELAAAVLLLAIFVIVRRLRGPLRRASLAARSVLTRLLHCWRSVRRRLRAHSEAATRVLPHVMYAIGAIAVHTVFFDDSSGASRTRRLTLLSSSWLRTVGLVLVAFVWPAIRSVRLLYMVAEQESENGVVNDHGKHSSGIYMRNVFSGRPTPIVVMQMAVTSLLSFSRTFLYIRPLAVLLLSNRFNNNDCVGSKNNQRCPTIKAHKPSRKGKERKQGRSYSIRRLLILFVSTITRDEVDSYSESLGVTKENINRSKDNDSTMVLTPTLIHKPLDINNDNNNTGTKTNNIIGLHRRRTAGQITMDASTTSKPCFLDTPALSFADDGDKGNRKSASSHVQVEQRVLRFWVVMVVAWSARSLLHMVVPSVSLVRTTLSAIDVALFYFVLWAQLHVTAGADLVYVILESALRRKGVLQGRQSPAVTPTSFLAWILSMLGKYGGGGGHRNNTSSTNNDPAGAQQQLSVLLRIARSLGIASSLRPRHVWRFFLDSGLAIGLFMLLALIPRWLAVVLTILTGAAWPCVRSAAALDMDNESKDDGCDSLSISSSSSSSSFSSSSDNGKERNEYGGKDEVVMPRKIWLAYWPLYALLEVVYAVLGRWLRWLPLWPHVKMAAVVWLQADNFAGAFAALDWVMERFDVVLTSVTIESPPKLGKRKWS